MRTLAQQKVYNSPRKIFSLLTLISTGADKDWDSREDPRRGICTTDREPLFADI